MAILLLLGTPFLGAQAGLYDDRVLPGSASSRQVQDQIRANFTSQEASALSVVAATAGPPGPQRDQAVDRHAAALSSLDGAARVDTSAGSHQRGRRVAPPTAGSARFSNQHGTWLAVVPSVEPISAAGQQLVHDIRSTPAPFATLVTGPSAELVDPATASSAASRWRRRSSRW